jgi:hypothetical protein
MRALFSEIVTQSIHGSKVLVLTTVLVDIRSPRVKSNLAKSKFEVGGSFCTTCFNGAEYIPTG